MRKPIKTRMAFAESCGVQDPKLDTFADVNRAATRFLLKNDAGYLKNSNATKARAVARKNDQSHPTRDEKTSTKPQND